MARKNANLRYALENDHYAHLYLCHGDGSVCEDGCNRLVDPKRLAAYQAEGRADAIESGEIEIEIEEA